MTALDGAAVPLRAHDSVARFERLSVAADSVDAAGVQRFLAVSGLELIDAAGPQSLRLRGLRLDGFLVAHARIGGLTLKWSRQRGSARRRCLYAFVVKGELEIRSEGQHVSSSSGGIGLVAPGGEAVTLRVAPESELLFFSFDAAEIEPVVLEAGHLRELPANSIVFRAAYSYLIATASTPEPNDAASRDILRSLTRDMARGLVMESNPRGGNSDIVDRARTIMEHRFRSPRFSPQLLAEELEISQRSLERAFSKRGMRVADELRKVRAAHALHLLERNAAMPVEVVASACGFGSQENLRRATVRYYEASPSRLRRSALQAGVEQIDAGGRPESSASNEPYSGLGP